MKSILTTVKKPLVAGGLAATALITLSYASGSFFGGASAPLVEEAAATVRPHDGPAAGAQLHMANFVEPALPEPMAPPPPQPIVRTVSVESGDNLMKVLVRAGADRKEAHVAIQSLDNLYDPSRDLRVGDELQITLGPAEIEEGSSEADEPVSGFVLSALTLPVSYDREVAIDRGDDGSFSAREVLVPLAEETVAASGQIDSSLFVDGTRAGIPTPVLIEMIRIFSYDVDFQRDIWAGDGFEILYERKKNADGQVVHNGEVLYAKLTLRGEEFPLYRYETSKGDLDYFNEKGESVRKALMKTPIDGARLSSTFGKRKHPILGYTKMHTGVDFAAPSGTPIYAAGDGTVLQAGVHGGYGNYVRLRHNGTYQTAYAHMKGFARGIRKGARVRQGQIIGYVGTTGRSTGPHLHYEVLTDGRQINPLGLKLPSGETLKGTELAKFQAMRNELDTRYASLHPDVRIARSALPVPCAGEDAGC